MSDSQRIISDRNSAAGAVQAEVAESTSEAASADVQPSTPSDLAESVARSELDSTASNVSSNPPDGVGQDDGSYFGLRRGDQIFAGVLMAAALVLGLVHWFRVSNWGREPIEIIRHESFQVEYRLDINQASWVEFAQLNGIGPTLAQRIIDSREQDGPFASIDDLQRVNGIGPKKVASMRPNLKPVEP